MCTTAKSAKDTLPGLTYSAFTLTQSDFQKSCEQLKTTTPTKTGVATTIPNTADYRTASSYYGIIYEGLFKAETTGKYGFAGNFVGRFRMWVAGAQVLDSDSLHLQTYDWRDGGRVMLQKGLHPMRLELFAVNPNRLSLWYQKPGRPDTVMASTPDNLLFHTSDPGSVKPVWISTGKSVVAPAHIPASFSVVRTGGAIAELVVRAAESYSIDVYDMRGKVVLHRCGMGVIRVPLKGPLGTGILTVRLRTSSGTTVIRNLAAIQQR